MLILSTFPLLRTGDERIELPPKVLETPIIPFDQSPTLDIPSKPHTLNTYTSYHTFFPNTTIFCKTFVLHFRSSPRPISNSQLHALRHFHPCPIYLVVFKGVYFLKNGISHLEGGFTLRCLQRLSLPDLATRPWLWQANRSTSGPSIPVLSY